MTKEELAKYIDHTLLAPQAGIREIVILCQEAKRYGFASVCVNPVYVSAAANELEGSGVKVCTVVGFPLGATTTADKISEAKINVNSVKVLIDGSVHILLFTSKNIEKGEILYYNYNGDANLYPTDEFQ